MTTAESIVKEYLDQGYSLEALRLLAESRPQPVGHEMLTVIDAMEADAEPVACDTEILGEAGFSETISDNTPAFFIAEGEVRAEEEPGINFDLMAATLPPESGRDAASNEESVADIIVGVDDTAPAEPKGAVKQSMKTPAAKAETGDIGVWSRLWALIPKSKMPALAPIEETAEIVAAEASAEEATAPEVMSGEPAFAAVEVDERATDLPEMNYVEDEQHASLAPEMSGGAQEIEEAKADEGDLEPPAALDDSPEHAAEAPVKGGDEEVDGENVAIPQNEQNRVDVSADYIPGAMSELYDDAASSNQEEIAMDKRRLQEAIARSLDAEGMDAENAGSSPEAEEMMDATEEAAADIPEARLFADEVQEENAMDECQALEEPEADSHTEAAIEQAAESDASLPESEDVVETVEQSAGDILEVRQAADAVQEENAMDECQALEEPEADSHTEAATEQAAESDASLPESEDVVETAEQSAGDIPETQQSADAVQEENAMEACQGSEEPEAVSHDGIAAETDTENGIAPLESEQAIPIVEQSIMAGPEAHPALDESDDKVTRKERRRRDRAQKRKEKKAKKASARLPEIVLTRSEGTEMMIPESEDEAHHAETAAHASEDASEDVLKQLDAIADKQEEQRDSADAMSIITPADLIAAAEETGFVDVMKEAEENQGQEEPSSILEDAAAAVQDEPQDVLESASTEADAGESPLSEQAEILETSSAEETLEEMSASSNKEQADSASAEAEAVADAGMVSGDDHLMIIASGGFDLEKVERLLASEEEEAESLFDDDSSDESESAGSNVILFQDKFPLFAGIVSEEDEYEEEDVESFQPVLRMLPTVVEPEESMESAAIAVEEPVAQTETPVAAVLDEVAEEIVENAQEETPALTDGERLCLLRAFSGAPAIDEWLDDGDTLVASGGHVILEQESESEPADLMAREVGVRAEMEREYQERLDAFAARLLEAQAQVADGERRVREKAAEMAAKDSVLAEMQTRLNEEEKKQKSLAKNLDESRRETGARQAELDRMNGMQEEHERLFEEFEDLRLAYNEVVTDVMPELQNERDDLALTVERQIASEKKVRRSLNSSRKRLAVSYVLSAAACVMIIALPIANWLKSSEAAKADAVDRQRISELSANLEREVQQNVEAKSVIADLEQKVNRIELANRQTTRNSRPNQQASQGIAVFPPVQPIAEGNPTRASEMALQATPRPGGGHQYNEVRDPAGSIESLLAQNRRSTERNAPQMAQTPPASARRPEIPVSSVAQTNRQSSLRPGQAPASAPAVQARPAQTVATAQPPRPPAQQATHGEVKATVKKGEGVSQVVYRVLGTWDPEVVAWVIRENKIRSNQRGNPLIQPGQELRLPKDGKIDQTAAATRRR